MPEIELVAVLNMSAGNESVGDMWLETKTFKITDSMFEIIKWAAEKTCRQQIELFRGNLRITIKQ